MSPKSERATLIKQSDQKCSGVPVPTEYPELRKALESLNIERETIKKIVDMKPYETEASALYNTLRFETSLDDHQILLIVSEVRPPLEVDNMLEIHNQQARKDELDKIKYVHERTKKEEERKFQYANDLPLALKMSTRDIRDPKFTILVVGSRIDDQIGSRFNSEKTVFADFMHADLCGDIHETVNDIPPGKKFKSIYFTALPGTIFDNPKKNRILFNKINNLLDDGGKLTISFGTSSCSYNDQTFSTGILAPSGFGRFCSLRETRANPIGVNMTAYKVGEPQGESPALPEPVRREASSSASCAAPSTQYQPAGRTSEQMIRKEYTPTQKALLKMLQGGAVDHKTIKFALMCPSHPDHDLSINEFALLKVRYDAWQEKKPHELPCNIEIDNFDELFQQARKRYKELIGLREAPDEMPGATPVPEPANRPAGPDQHSNSVSEQQINNIIEALKAKYADLDASIIGRNIRFLRLSEDDILHAEAGNSADLDKVLMACLTRDQGWPVKE